MKVELELDDFDEIKAWLFKLSGVLQWEGYDFVQRAEEIERECGSEHKSVAYWLKQSDQAKADAAAVEKLITKLLRLRKEQLGVKE